MPDARTPTTPTVAFCAALAAAGAITSAARGQLRSDQVLVVYDSRIPSTLEVAEYYAGSAAVPGGVGTYTGSRPGVRVFDLATGGAPAPVTADNWINQPEFRQRIRDPIRAHLTGAGLAATVRCIVMTRGLPHRLADANTLLMGDAPASAANAWNAGNYTAASVDCELALLWQSIETGEANGGGDSKSDGAILNPYWQKTLGIEAWPTRHIQTAKNFVRPTTSPVTGIGQYWSALPASAVTAPTATNTTPGDIYLVCRLDGPTFASVQGMIDRARNLVVDTATATVVLDESGSNAVTDSGTNSELDNQGSDVVWGGDDYEQTRDAFTADGRYRRGPANNPPAVVYNADSGAAQVLVGPLIAYGQGIVVSTPVILLTHFGANHAPQPPWLFHSSTYAASFAYAPGAIFNSMESYNGRGFGLGTGTTLFGQEQASDFIGAGGTFAVATVFEPFAEHVADSLMLSRNFLLGRLSWAEAAWSSIPVLSWQGIVLGDPLARVTRTSDDRSGDSRISIEDLYAWHASPADVNNNGAADNTDRTLIEAAARSGERSGMRGSTRP